MKYFALALTLILAADVSADEVQLKRQMATYRAALTTAGEEELLRLHRSLLPSDEDLKAMYGENAVYAMAKRDAELNDFEKNVSSFLTRPDKEPPLKADQISVDLGDDSNDVSVLMAKKHKLLKGDFQIRTVSMQLPESLEGYGAMIYVNARWVVFIGLDRITIERDKKRKESEQDGAHQPATRPGLRNSMTTRILSEEVERRSR